MRARSAAFAVLLAVSAHRPLAAQEIQIGGDLRTAPAHKQHVELETASVRVKAGVPGWVALRFQVDPGFHINSHAPHDELLMPTVVAVDERSLKVLAERYPPGVPLRLEVGGSETLSTYQGEFQVELQVKPPKGATLLSGTMRYQACDARACFPPRSLPVQVTVTAE